MHISQYDFTPALCAVQFLPTSAQARAERIMRRAAIQDRVFARLLAEAKRKAKLDLKAYEADLTRQAEERAALEFDDVPW